MGVDRKRLDPGSRAKLQKILLCAERTRRPYRAPGGEGWFTSLRAELLPALPAGGAPRRGGRHFSLPHRFSVRRAPATRRLIRRKPPAKHQWRSNGLIEPR